jgi:predicted nucleic acid-binding protein
VVIGALDDADAHHEAAVDSVVSRGDDDLLLPASAYAEALVAPARLGLLDEVKRDLASLSLRVDPIDERIAECAARLRAQHRSLRLPDALVIAHAEVVDADELLTTDATWARFSRRVRVVG